MPSRRSWSLLFIAPLCFAAWAAGCADETSGAGAAPDSGAPDVAPDLIAPPEEDAGPDAGPMTRDCAADRGADGVWEHLACTGLYASFADKTVAPDVKPYKPGVELWSDGAEKQRWIHLPPNRAIDIRDWDEWVFPVGTKLWKEFTLGGKRVETRLYIKLADGSWGHAVYRWSSDETDAVRKDGGESVAGIGLDGGAYEIPSAGQCDQCHMGRKDQVLGFDAVSLGLADATGQTLATLAEDGRFGAPPPATALAFPGDSAAQAAVGWLHANCGACHNESASAAGKGRGSLLVRASELTPTDAGAIALEQLDLWTQSYCVDTFRTNPVDGAPYTFIYGGDPSKSLIAVLSRQRVALGALPNPGTQMPPIVSRAVDHQGVSRLGAWITSLAPCPP